jgi:uncharacterized MAPEG superfamily protein
MTIALWCLLAAGLVPQLFGVYAKASKGFDNNNARAWLATVEGKKARAVAAMANGYEGLPLFVAAVLTAHMLKGPNSTADLLALAYIAIRVVYGLLYIAGLGTLRSLVWCGGLACIIGLFVIAA